MKALEILAEDVQAGWAWLQDKAAACWAWLQPTLAAPLKLFESQSVQDFFGAAAAIVQKLLVVKDLPTLETSLLNVLSGLGGELLQLAKTLGSSVLQTILGALQLHAASAA